MSLLPPPKNYRIGHSCASVVLPVCRLYLKGLLCFFSIRTRIKVNLNLFIIRLYADMKNSSIFIALQCYALQ